MNTKITKLLCISLVLVACSSPPPPSTQVKNVSKHKGETTNIVTKSETIPGSPLSIEELKGMASSLGANATAISYANLLENISNSVVQDPSQQESINSLENDIVGKLRQAVKNELRQSHLLALKAPKYSQALEHYRNAQAVISLYPMSDDQSVISEAESLSLQHQDIQSRIEKLRRQRYNYWAAQQLKSTLQILKEKNKFLVNELYNSYSKLSNLDMNILNLTLSLLIPNDSSIFFDKALKLSKSELDSLTPVLPLLDLSQNDRLRFLINHFNQESISNSEKSDDLHNIFDEVVRTMDSNKITVSNELKEAFLVFQRQLQTIVVNSGPEYLARALDSIKLIEPTLLEPAVDSLYQYAIGQLMEESGKGKRSDIVIMLADPSTTRKLLEEF